MPAALTAPGGQTVLRLLPVIAWGLSILATYWDLRRQYLPRGEKLAWLALVALVPGVGLAAYLLFRLFNWAFPPPPGYAGRRGAAIRRVTQLRPDPAGARTGTIAATDLVQPTLADRRLAPLPRGIILTGVGGPHAGQDFPVDALPARLGRGSEASVRLDRDLGVSRLHAEIYRQDGALRLRDLGSSHGTRINGVAIHDKALAPGDHIELGLSTLLVKEAAQ